MSQITYGRKIQRHLTALSFILLYIFIIPPVILLCIPVYIFRFVASQAKKVLRKDLDKLVNTRSSVLSCDAYDTKPSWNVVVWLTQEGVLDLEKFQTEFFDEFVNCKLPNGKLRYPEYQQHFETWWGFQFWKWDTEFDIKNHIRHYDGEHQDSVINDNKLLQIIKELTWKPWNSKRSPWEFLQIPNYQMTNDTASTTKSILIFRIHHGLGDGYFILKLLMQDICGIHLEDSLPKPKYIKRNILKTVLLTIMFLIRVPYEFVEMLTTANDRNAWHIPEGKMIRPMNAALTEQIKLDYVKEIKNSHGVSFTAVILAGITGGIRNMMIQKGLEVPAEMHTAVEVPLPNRPPKLRNHLMFSFISLPLGLKDPMKRLKKIEKNLASLKNSTTTLMNFIKIYLIGGILKSMMKPIIKNHFSTCLISNFPGSPVIPNFKGLRVLDMMFGAGLGVGSVGLGYMMISHTDHIRILSTADPNILSSDDEVTELNQNILEEIAILKELSAA